jgi:hypothetical protein
LTPGGKTLDKSSGCGWWDEIFDEDLNMVSIESSVTPSAPSVV